MSSRMTRHIWVVLGMHQPYPTNLEEDNLPRSDLSTIQWSSHLNVGNVEKDHGLVEVVVAEVDVEVLELGTDSYKEVVPAPQGGRLW